MTCKKNLCLDINEAILRTCGKFLNLRLPDIVYPVSSGLRLAKKNELKFQSLDVLRW